MKEKETNKKAYRVVQIEGKITWKVEELWNGGIERAPYADKETAIRHEENIARDNGFIDDLVLQDMLAEEEKISPTDAFERDSRGIWHCKRACAIEIGDKDIVFTEGMTFRKGSPFMTVDVAEWLDENS